MMPEPVYAVEPWRVRETGLHLDRLPQTESIFALANGHIGLRGNLDEGEPHGLPGTYLNSVHELRPLPYAEAGYGYPESGQTVINVTNGKLIRLLVDDEPFDLRYGEVRNHERVLDLRKGTLERVTEWRSPAGRSVRVRSTRMVSFAQRAVAAISYEVEPLDGSARIVVQSELVANEELPPQSKDPRAAAALESPLVADRQYCNSTSVGLLHRTSRSELRVGAGMDHTVAGPENTKTSAHVLPDIGRFTVTAVVPQGQRLRIEKFLAYGWSSTRSSSAISDQVAAALSGAKDTGWEGLLAEQKEYLDDFWDRSDVELDGDPQVQQAVRFALFHILQAGARAEGRGIPAKGLTGPGYDGHVFWDTETFVLPVLTYTLPEAAAHALQWRHSTLPAARDRAAQLGLEGAAFPWRTIAGQECSSYWPAGTAAFHIGADIADAVVRYYGATGDEEFSREIGLDLMVETARLWRSLGHFDKNGSFRISGVTGPDEYSAVADNNVYTNLMAQRNLRVAAEAAQRHPGRAADLMVGARETAEWRAAAENMFIPYDEELGVHPQSESFTKHEVWDFAATKPDHYPLLLNYPYFDLYRKQVIKQADLVLAMQLCGDAFTDEQKARNFAYYERLTVRDSSLSANTQSVLAAEVGHLDLAYDYLGEAALMDLDDLEHNTGDGLHIASLAGAWTAIVAGFGGMRNRDGALSFAPRLPDRLGHIRYNLCFRGRRLQVRTTATATTYTLRTGEPLELTHHGTGFTVSVGEPVTLPIPPAPVREAPKQPQGREPLKRARQG